MNSLKPVDRASGAPLYRQIQQQIRMLLSEHTRPGERLFTEQQLSETFGVSRMTVRQAVDGLVDEGLLRRVRGAGTFLSSPKVTDSLQQMWNHFEDWAAQGRKVSMEILDFRQVESDRDTAHRLMIAERTEVLFVARCWCVDDVPIGLGYFCLHPRVGRSLPRADVEHQHIYLAVSKHLGLAISGEQVEIEAAGASHVTATRLRIREGDALLVRRVTQYYGKGDPLVTATLFYRGDLYRYSVYVPAVAASANKKPPLATRGPVVEEAVAGDVSAGQDDMK